MTLTPALSSVGTQDAAGNELKNEAMSANDDGVARVVAALIAGDPLEVAGQQVHNFTFALVAPLGADDDYAGLMHARSEV